MGMPCSSGSTFLYHSTAQQSTEEQVGQLLSAVMVRDVAAANVMSLQTDEHSVTSSFAAVCSECSERLLEELPCRQLYPACLCVGDDHNVSE
jgi:hypothetical protein